MNRPAEPEHTHHYSVNQEEVSFYPWEQRRKPVAATAISLLIVEAGTSHVLLSKNLLEDQANLVAEIHLAATLADARSLLTGVAHKFDVVLLDLHLPDSDGLDTYFTLRRLRPELPFIILSDEHDENAALQLVQEGAQDCLSRDHVSSTLLARSIRYAIERKSILEQLKATQLQLIQAEKMESIGRLAAGVAHEVKNPLAQIQLGIDYLKRHASGVSARIPKLLDAMSKAVGRADEVICDLVTFSNDRRLEMKKCDVESIIDSALSLVNHDLTRHHIRLERAIATNLPLISCDYGHLEQALVNILLNAVQAMEGGGTLTVSAYKGILEKMETDDGARTSRRMNAGDEVITISIADTGTGIPADQISAAFDPFFTTKPTGLGTGLGLTVVRKIIDLHGGKMSIANRLISGVEVVIILSARP
jgi:signal transduction histidine kinase